MTTTQNLNLPQWEKTDRIMMDDFNDAMSKIDAAVNAVSEATVGSIKITAGTYTGDGNVGMSAPNSLTFARKPDLLIISGSWLILDFTAFPTVGCSLNVADGGETKTILTTWNGNTVSWYSGYSVDAQCNKSGMTYHYYAVYF